MKKFRLGKVVALLLVAALLLGSFGLTGHHMVFAAENEAVVETTEEATDQAEEEVIVEAPAAGDTSEDESLVDEAVVKTDEGAADAAVQDETADKTEEATDNATTTDAGAASDEAADDASSDGAVTDEAEAPAEEVAMPAQSFDGKTDHATVKVTAGEDTFPEGTYMKVKDVPQAEVQDAVEGAVDGEVTDITAVDITFYDKDDNEIQPANDNSVQVVIRTPKMDAKADHEVVHIDKSGEAEVMTDAKVSGNSAVVEAESFSIYAVVEEGLKARLEINFFDQNGKKIETMYVKDEDALGDNVAPDNDIS